MKKLINEVKKRLDCRCECYDDMAILIPYDVRYDIKFEIRKVRQWYVLSEHDGVWYLLGESKSYTKVVDRIIKEHGGLAL